MVVSSHVLPKLFILRRNKNEKHQPTSREEGDEKGKSVGYYLFLLKVCRSVVLAKQE